MGQCNLVCDRFNPINVLPLKLFLATGRCLIELFRFPTDPRRVLLQAPFVRYNPSPAEPPLNLVQHPARHLQFMFRLSTVSLTCLTLSRHRARALSLVCPIGLLLVLDIVLQTMLQFLVKVTFIQEIPESSLPAGAALFGAQLL